MVSSQFAIKAARDESVLVCSEIECQQLLASRCLKQGRSRIIQVNYHMVFNLDLLVLVTFLGLWCAF